MPRPDFSPPPTPHHPTLQVTSNRSTPAPYQATARVQLVWTARPRPQLLGDNGSLGAQKTQGITARTTFVWRWPQRELVTHLLRYLNLDMLSWWGTIW